MGNSSNSFKKISNTKNNNGQNHIIMKEIIIGREGEQKFPINNPGVSRKHAKIAINDDGNWWLEDLGSENHTYIQQKTGEYVSIGKKRITSNTNIRLGDETVGGIHFIARQVFDGISKESNSFLHDFQNLKKKMEELNKERVSIKKKIKMRRVIIALVPLLLLFISMLPIFNKEMQMIVMRASLVASSLLSIVFINNEQLEDWVKRRNKLIRCPNPNCNKVLTDEEVETFQCYRCGTKGYQC